MKRLTLKDMQMLARERGNKCLSLKYINNHTKLLWECREGHQWRARPKSIKSGGGCPKCANNKKKS